ncbi:hypothetical protein Poli38472_008441 [Pythium oligandrum]|uniref:Uncharacterized protein n=1 Tax=Pythium oligandrum TaxID=41045 RepID=A0A8K1CLM9_PYTOL|nr:hypothetical protein Poli38472_008441 [Pythium oligandrum]|eukprot:TMW65799.1 hypothetical protein Poli38472_008441 [Pythium oligandrum]
MKPTAKKKRERKNVVAADVAAFLARPAESDEADVEWESTANLKEDPLHSVWKVLDRKRIDGTAYNIVDWELTWEPRVNVTLNTIAIFEAQRRRLVRHILVTQHT